LTNWEEKTKKIEKVGNKMEEAGKKMQNIGCLLTGIITIPFIGLVFLGVPGLIIGIIVGGLIAYGAKKQ
jgi:hypothetical protein